MKEQKTQLPCFVESEAADSWIDRNCTRCKKRWSERAGAVTAFHCRIQSDIIRQMFADDEIRLSSYEATRERTCPDFIDRAVPPRKHRTRKQNPNQLTIFNNNDEQ